MDSKDFTGCGDGIWTTWPSGYEKNWMFIQTISKIKGLSTLARILRRPNADESADKKGHRRQGRGMQSIFTIVKL